MKNIRQKILFAEEKWLRQVTISLEALFKETFLPSHDQTHHLRTWRAAKEIITEISEFTVTLSPEFIEAVLLACMFHDAGITETRGLAHGKKGKDIYIRYIAENCQEPPVLHSEIARAIEMHDQKTENIFTSFHWDKTPDLLTLISIADDMDALGTIGIYRYAEIYLHREVPLKLLGIVLLENVSVRYNNFSKASTLVPSLINKTKPKFQQVITFYDNYNQQLLVETDPYKVYSGHIGVINYIRNFSVIGKINPIDYPEALQNFKVGKFVSDFFTGLKRELEESNR